MSLIDVLEDAQVIVVDSDRRRLYAWYGGTGVNVFREDGTMVDYFTLDSSKLTPTVVRRAIDRLIALDD